jgi:crotonobetainyl-CoA:carnitine CoA-transferase CaiB-like acyl-CoA transferase
MTGSSDPKPQAGTTTGAAPAPLRGIRVIELAHWMAGPAAGGLLADWGADVVKIEPPGGDPMRNIFAAMGSKAETPAAFISANRAKRSITLSVQHKGGARVLRQLLETADVLLTNLRPRALEKFGLSPKEIAERYPRLVYCSLTAYGWGGPDQDRPGYDIAGFYGRAGIAHEITTQGSPPAALLQGLGDTYTAMSAAAGIMAALLERGQTGRGRFVEASLMRTGMWALAGELGQKAMGGNPRPPAPREKSRMPLYNSYLTSDGRWFFLVGVEAQRHLQPVLAAIGRTDLLADARFENARAVAKNSIEFIAILDAAFASQPLAYWAAAFDAHDVFWAPIQTPAEVVEDPQAHASGAWIDVDQGDAGARVKSVDAPLRFDGVSRAVVPGPPAAGAHTREVLTQLGLSPAEIEQVLAEGVKKA